MSDVTKVKIKRPITKGEPITSDDIMIPVTVCNKCGLEKYEWEELMTDNYLPEYGLFHKNYCDGDWVCYDE